jgi:outer membrane protein insertion porin family
LGVQGGADYVVWGSLTWIGQQFSMDAKTIKTFGKAAPKVFFVEGQGIETLLGKVKELADLIGMKIFQREKVAEVLIKGNKRIESDAIKRIIKTAPGDIMLAKSLSEDLKAVYAMGYFDDIRIEAEEGADGKIIIFQVKEKPTIRRVRLTGNKHIKDEDIQEALNIRTGSILNVNRVQDNIKLIETLYMDKNYHNVRVEYNVKQRDHNQADLEFIVTEGEKVRIKSVTFEGNQAYKDKKLKKLMETEEKGFFSWLTSSGELDMDSLRQDVAKLSAFYHNSGYIQAKVGDPIVEFKENWIYVTIKIVEGPRFKIGKVDITGDLIFPKQTLLEKVMVTQETFFNREVVRNDALTLTDFYADEGYAYADIKPRVDRDLDKLEVNISYDIQKNKQVFFEAIIISGNTKTRDKVIRRELKVYEQELYNGRGLKRGVRNLYRLDYFEDIKVNTLKGSTDDQMILKIDVTEKATGTFTFGGGYSSIEDVFFATSITQRNLFGKGQSLSLKLELGARTNKLNLGFTEPWLFDIPLSAGFDLYKWDVDFDRYDKNSLGGGLRFSYPVFDFTRFYISYKYDDAEIENVRPDAPNSILDLEGNTLSSTITTRLRYDSRDKAFNATRGSDHSVTLDYAGLGGDIGFTKIVGKTSWYKLLYKDLIGFVHGEGGYVADHSGKILPDWERFYLGGMNSLRGYEWRDISPVEVNRNGFVTQVGGNRYVQANVELRYPILKDQGLFGIVFLDIGDVYNDDESVDLSLSELHKSTGFGFRWYSPMGPIRLEYGYILDPKELGPSGGRWEFAMGDAF